jgi:uncharacterized caspase-like protein
MLRALAAATFVLLAVSAHAERRVALVIGEDDYKTIRPLDNAVADAQSIEQTLEKLGFEVTLETDRDLRRMRRALDDFREDGAGADVALVFFAGHGVEIAGENRLLPTDADAASLDALKASTLPLEEVRAAVSDVADVGLIILDACRSDPFGSGADGSGRGAVAIGQAKEVKPGLGRVGRAEGILFAFSAAPGETASDGEDGHSPFAAALARYLGTDGIEVRSALTLVQQEVYDKTRGRQLPYVESGLPTLFFAATASDALPERERLLLAMANLTPELRAEVETIAAESDMPLAPLYGALIGSNPSGSSHAERSAMLREAAAAFVRVREEMQTLGADDPEVARLRREAEEQLAIGAFDTAQARLDEAADIDSASRKALKANFVTRTLSEAATRYVGGGTSEAKGALFQAMRKYREAAALYAEVANEPLPEPDRARQLEVLEALARTQIRLGALADALDSIDALAAAATKYAEADPSSAGGQNDIAVAETLNGDVRVMLGDLDGAMGQYDAAGVHARKAAELDPGNPMRKRNLAVALDKIGGIKRSRGDLPGAMANYTEAIDISLDLLGRNPLDEGLQRDLSYYDIQLGDLLRLQGNNKDALAAFRSALDIRRKLAANQPADTQRQFDLGVAAERVGDLLAETGEIDEAEKFLAERHAIIGRLAARSSENLDWQRDLSVSHEKLGDLRQKRSDTAGALAEYRAALAIMAALSAAEPSNMSWERDLSISHRKVGEVLLAQGDAAGALAEYRESLKISAAIAPSDPSNLDWQFDLATGRNRIGDAENALGNKAAAIENYRASRDVMAKLAAADPSNAGWQWNLFASHLQLAEAGDDPVRNYTAGLAILERLDARGQLQPSQRQWIETLRKALAAGAGARDCSDANCN